MRSCSWIFNLESSFRLRLRRLPPPPPSLRPAFVPSQTRIEEATGGEERRKTTIAEARRDALRSEWERKRKLLFNINKRNASRRGDESGSMMELKIPLGLLHGAIVTCCLGGVYLLFWSYRINSNGVYVCARARVCDITWEGDNETR